MKRLAFWMRFFGYRWVRCAWCEGRGRRDYLIGTLPPNGKKLYHRARCDACDGSRGGWE